MEKVKVYIHYHGQNIHELGFGVVYDITNDIQLGYHELDELENWEWTECKEIKIVDAIKVEDEYYINLSL